KGDRAGDARGRDRRARSASPRAREQGGAGGQARRRDAGVRRAAGGVADARDRPGEKGLLLRSGSRPRTGDGLRGRPPGPARPHRRPHGGREGIARKARGAIRGTLMAAPELEGVSHVALTVTDLEASKSWYERLFEAPVLWEEHQDGHDFVALLIPPFLIGLHTHGGTAADDRFEET